MNRRRKRHRREIFREVDDGHIPHAGCLFDAASKLIPPTHYQAWEKGLSWLPKCDGWTQSFGLALASVLAGQRPLLYGWKPELIKETAEDNQLNYLDFGWVGVCFRSTNSDLAELMAWAHTQPSGLQHLVNGVVLGYPLMAIESWIKSGCPGRTLREVLTVSDGI